MPLPVAAMIPISTTVSQLRVCSIHPKSVIGRECMGGKEIDVTEVNSDKETTIEVLPA
jgi:hypothetical protein